MTRKTVKVRNTAGIHCRPTSMILLEARKFPGCKFKIMTANGDSDLNSMLSLISLGLSCGDGVTVSANGENEIEACEKISDLFAYEFDFPPQA